MPNRLMTNPKELTKRSWLVFISGGSRLRQDKLARAKPRGWHRSAYRRCVASKIMKIEIRSRKMPFAKPESVSILPYLKHRSTPRRIGPENDGKITNPYVNLSLGGHVAMMDANRPTPIAIQSKPMWIATWVNVTNRPRYQNCGHVPSDIRPRLFVQTPYSICTIM